MGDLTSGQAWGSIVELLAEIFSEVPETIDSDLRQMGFDPDKMREIVERLFGER